MTEKRIKYGIGILLVLITGLFLYGFLFRKPVKTFSENSKPASKADFHVTAVDLINSFDKNESWANERYFNKILSVSGIIQTFGREQNGNYVLTLGYKSEQPATVTVNLDRLYDDVDLLLNPGDSITIRGICCGQVNTIVMLQCIIEK